MCEAKTQQSPMRGRRAAASQSRRRPAARRTAAGLLACALAALACGGDIESRMAEVRALQDVGQFSASIEELREILAIAPDLPEASYRLGVALVQTGEPSRAVWALEKAAEADEFAIPASLLLASAHFAAQNYEATVAACDRVLELDPERHAALLMRARGNLGSGRLDAAMADAERLIEALPDDYSVRVLHATVLSDLGRTEEARVATDLVKKIALEGGDPANAHRGCLAPAMFARDNLEDEALAQELYDDCIERFPTNGFVIGEAIRFYDQIGKRDKATGLARDAVEKAPENLSLRSQLAQRLSNLGEEEEALQVLLDAVESFKSAGAWNLLANYYRQQDEPEKALDAIEKVSELAGGGNDQLRFTQADVLIDVGQLERAEEIAAALQEPTYAKLLRGRIALERGDAATALQLFDQGIRAWPDNAGARYLAGLAARELGDGERSISELREAVRVDNSATPAAAMLARVYYERGQYAEAIRFARVARRRRGPEAAEVYVIAARSFSELGKYDDARKTAETIKSLPGEELTAAVELATIERTFNGPDASVAVIEESGLDLSDPANERLLRAWTDNLLEANRAEQALARIDAAIAAHPEVASFQDIRGTVLTRLGRDADARAAYEKSLALDPENAAAWGGLGTLAARGNDLPKAIELYDKASGFAPEASSYPYSAAQLTLAGGDNPAAEKRLREIVRSFPGHAGARNDLAWILAEKGVELDWALALAQEAQRLEPSPEVLDTLGWVRFKRGEMAAAVAALEQAVEARSDSPSIRYRLALALRQSGDQERAREMLQAAIDAGAFPEAEQARRELAQIDRP
jgi:tetratricopeptide (TPR) repeat protein